MKAKVHANYILVNRDVLYCPVKEIPTTKTAAIYIKGKQDYVTLKKEEY